METSENTTPDKTAAPQTQKPPLKKGLHPRNLHRHGYDFDLLIQSCPQLAPYVKKNRYGNQSVLFEDPQAVRALNRALLRHFYAIDWWDIPENFLCPPIPGRADYIHYVADILASCAGGTVPRGQGLCLLDIGTGANCVYPLIGNREYGWRFVGSDIDAQSLASAHRIVEKNPVLSGQIELRHQQKAGDIFKGIILPGERFDFTVCNPPFHASQDNAQAANERKRNNLNLESGSKLNFGGQPNELVTQGGEASFVRRMIDESARNAGSCLWFSTLVSKKNTMEGVYKTLKKVKAVQVKTVNMAQGQKTSRFIAWTFFDKEGVARWAKEHW